MAKSYAKAKGRGAKDGAFLAIPRVVADSESFMLVSGNAIKVLLCLVNQFRGHNNGDLCAPASYAKKYGLSKATWYKAIRELIAAELIICTRDPLFDSKNPHGQCALFALTWKSIDECGGKLDVNPTATPVRSFTSS